MARWKRWLMLPLALPIMVIAMAVIGIAGIVDYPTRKR